MRHHNLTLVFSNWDSNSNGPSPQGFAFFVMVTAGVVLHSGGDVSLNADGIIVREINMKSFSFQMRAASFRKLMLKC